MYRYVTQCGKVVDTGFDDISQGQYCIMVKQLSFFEHSIYKFVKTTSLHDASINQMTYYIYKELHQLGLIELTCTHYRHVFTAY